MTTDELVQFVRELKMGQIKTQLDADRSPNAYRYLKELDSTWMSRFEIVEEFFTDAKKRKL
jgi:hypothetical protein